MLRLESMVGGAFRLIKEKPGAVAVWMLIFLAGGIASTLAMRPFMETQLAVMRGQSPALGDLWSTVGPMLLVQLGLFLAFIIVYAAALRAVLRPHEGGLAYLRFGMDELRFIALTILFVILFYVGFVVLGFLVVGLFVAMIAGGGAAGAVAGALLVFLLVLFLIGLALWFFVRLSLAFPLTMLRRRIVIGEAWTLSRGRFWTMFGAYLVIFVIMIVFASISASFTTMPYLAELMRAGENPDAMAAAFENQLKRSAEINMTTILGWLVSAVGSGIWSALFAGAAGTAARDLTGDQLLAREFA